MKKNFIQVIVFLFLVGCSMTQATPKSAVEEVLKKYQMKDDTVLSQLDYVINQTTVYDDAQKEQYKGVLERQYSDMTYDIKDETIDGKNATVPVEIEVYDYSGITLDGSYEDMSVYNTSLLSAMSNTKERIKYTIEFNVRKVDGKWVVDNINDIDRKKIHGLY